MHLTPKTNSNRFHAFTRVGDNFYFIKLYLKAFGLYLYRLSLVIFAFFFYKVIISKYLLA